MKTALIVFAREPKIGKVKTRLAKDLTQETTLQLYTAFLSHNLKMAQEVAVDERILAYAGSGHSIPFLRKYEGAYSLRRQIGKGLGERMENILNYCNKTGYKKFIIMGTDCLTLESEEIEKVIRKLDQNDLVLGPCLDGGYYLIGLKRVETKLFRNIKWSTDLVLEQTLKKAQKEQMKVWLLPKKNDIDNRKSLLKYLNKDQNSNIFKKINDILSSHCL